MLPTVDTNVVAEGQALLIGQYKTKANVVGVLRAMLNRIQEVELVLWDVINSQLLTRTFPAGTAQGQFSGPPDQALLQTADLVGCPVGSFTTGQLAFLIQIWILARKSRGRMEDILSLCAKAFPGAFSYEEYYPAGFVVTVPGVPDASLIAPLAQAITLARPPGVAATLAWGVEPNDTFYFGDSAGGTLGSGLADSQSGTSAEGLLSAVEV